MQPVQNMQINANICRRMNGYHPVRHVSGKRWNILTHVDIPWTLRGIAAGVCCFSSACSVCHKAKTPKVDAKPRSDIDLVTD